jgi:hypothetical protein
VSSNRDPMSDCEDGVSDCGDGVPACGDGVPACGEPVSDQRDGLWPYRCANRLWSLGRDPVSGRADQMSARRYLMSALWGRNDLSCGD